MLRRLVAVAILGLSLAGCATLKDVATSTNTFAVCKTADVLTTATALSRPGFVESNPLIKATLAHGYFPLIALSVGLWYLLTYVDSPVATAATNTITCGAAANNAFLLLK